MAVVDKLHFLRQQLATFHWKCFPRKPIGGQVRECSGGFLDIAETLGTHLEISIVQTGAISPHNGDNRFQNVASQSIDARAGRLGILQIAGILDQLAQTEGRQSFRTDSVLFQDLLEHRYRFLGVGEDISQHRKAS